jgi:hypothetical protein
LICIEWCVAAGHLICGNILGTMLEPAQGGDSAASRPAGKISTETGSAQGTFFFAPRYCRHWKHDPT